MNPRVLLRISVVAAAIAAVWALSRKRFGLSVTATVTTGSRTNQVEHGLRVDWGTARKSDQPALTWNDFRRVQLTAAHGKWAWTDLGEIWEEDGSTFAAFQLAGGWMLHVQINRFAANPFAYRAIRLVGPNGEVYLDLDPARVNDMAKEHAQHEVAMRAKTDAPSPNWSQHPGVRQLMLNNGWDAARIGQLNRTRNGQLVAGLVHDGYRLDVAINKRYITGTGDWGYQPVAVHCPDSTTRHDGLAELGNNPSPDDVATLIQQWEEIALVSTDTDTTPTD